MEGKWWIYGKKCAGDGAASQEEASRPTRRTAVMGTYKRSAWRRKMQRTGRDRNGRPAVEVRNRNR